MKKVFNLIIVDESGSMSMIERETLLGLNETIETVCQMQKRYPKQEQRVVLLTFDSHHTRVIFDNEPAESVRKLTLRDYRPGGGTPLYDAIGLGISKVNALAGPDDKVLVTILTDGEENCSQEYNLTMVRNLIEKLKKAGWTFTLIGTDNLDVESMAGAMGVASFLSFSEDAAGTIDMFRRERRARASYNDCLSKNLLVSEDAYFKED